MSRPAKSKQGSPKSVIVVAGEGPYDREVLQILIPALLPKPCPKVVQIKSNDMRLHKANLRLKPRVDELRILANTLADSHGAELAGIVVHVDLDGVVDEEYDKVRKRLSDAFKNAFHCRTALALAAWEIEAWLMLFPEAFTKVRSSWRLKSKDTNRDLGMTSNAKETLRAFLEGQRYRESDAPKVMRAAIVEGEVKPNIHGRNRSYMEFVQELQGWSIS